MFVDLVAHPEKFLVCPRCEKPIGFSCTPQEGGGYVAQAQCANCGIEARRIIKHLGADFAAARNHLFETLGVLAGVLYLSWDDKLNNLAEMAVYRRLRHLDNPVATEIGDVE